MLHLILMSIVFGKKRLLFLILTLTSIFIYVSLAFAEDATSSTTRKEKVTQRKEDIREKAASREAALKAKLQTFKDKQKATIAEKVNTNLNKINQKMASEMLKHLTRMSEILVKLETRVNAKTPDIKDVSSAKEAIASASAAINSAKEAVGAQSEKDYTIIVTSEGKIRQDAQNMRKQLHTDLQALRKLVVDAKQEVSNAIRVAKSVKVEVPKEGTTSGQQ